MKPDMTRFLEVASTHLMTKTAQVLAPGYEQSGLRVLGGMLAAVRHECERAAAWRVEENGALRRLFAEAAPAVRATELGKRLEEAAAGEDSSLIVSDLERNNVALRGLLIDLHAHVEEIDSPEARLIEEKIWRELAASTERRTLPLPGLT